MEEDLKTRYSDAELEEFKAIILEKLEAAKAEYNTLREVVMHGGNNDIEDTSPSFRTVEDDGANQLSKEEASSLAQRQYKFIKNLEAALVRIENKTYGMTSPASAKKSPAYLKRSRGLRATVATKSLR